jgi:hypothetical protein
LFANEQPLRIGTSRERFPNLEAIQKQTSLTEGIHGPDYKTQEPWIREQSWIHGPIYESIFADLFHHL